MKVIQYGGGLELEHLSFLYMITLDESVYTRFGRFGYDKIRSHNLWWEHIYEVLSI